MHLAVAKSYVDGSETVNVLCKSKADINIQNDYGETALILAVNGSSIIQTTNNLLMFSANINTQNKYGYPALMYAVESKDIEFVDILCKHNANTLCNINIKNNDGNTALMLPNETLLMILNNLLMLCNVDINIKNNEGYNALMLVLKSSPASC